MSATARAAIYAPETDEAFLLLLTIEEASLSEPIRVCHNTENVTSRGDVYAAVEFGIELPAERGDMIETVRIVLDNVDRQIVQAIRQAVGRPHVTLEVVVGSDPDTVEAGPFKFDLESAEYDALAVVGELAFDDVSQLRSPAHLVTPWNFPDAF